MSTTPSQPPTQFMSQLEIKTASTSFVGAIRIRLLEEIARHGSITQAARHVPVAYKTAWDAIDAMNQLAAQPLVESVAGGRHGGGTRLTPYGHQVVAVYRALETEYQSVMDDLFKPDPHTAPLNQANVLRLLRHRKLLASVRNQWLCRITGLHESSLHDVVYLRLDPHNELTATLTKNSASRLKLTLNQEVLVLLKASAIALILDPQNPAIPANQLNNQLTGLIQHLRSETHPTEIVIALESGLLITAASQQDTSAQCSLQPGMRISVSFPSDSLIIVT